MRPQRKDSSWPTMVFCCLLLTCGSVRPGESLRSLMETYEQNIQNQQIQQQPAPDAAAGEWDGIVIAGIRSESPGGIFGLAPQHPLLVGYNQKGEETRTRADAYGKKAEELRRVEDEVGELAAASAARRKEIARLSEEIGRLRASPEPTDSDRKRISELEKECARSREGMAEAETALGKAEAAAAKLQGEEQVLKRQYDESRRAMATLKQLGDTAARK